MHVRIETGYDPSESVEETPEDAIFFPWILSGKFSPTYTRLLELLDHCDEPFYGSINSMPLLVCPLYRESPFSLKHLARAAVYKWCNYHSIDSLEIPEELKLFLKEFGYVCKSNSLSSMSQFFNGWSMFSHYLDILNSEVTCSFSRWMPTVYHGNIKCINGSL